MASYSGTDAKKYGRQTIFINKSEKELLSLKPAKLKKALEEYIPLIVEIHNANKEATRYLWDYYLGEQDIYQKQKYTRKEINNKKVENWAYAIIDFKKAWQLGNPIQYVMMNNSSGNEIEQLNKYVRFQNKQAKDQMIYEDVLVVGRGFRYQAPVKDDEAPFKIINIDRDSCEVIYSSGIEHEQLFSVVITNMEETILLNEEEKKKEYIQITIYLRDKQLTCNYREYADTAIQWEKTIKPIIIKEHVITEYYVNRDRISLIEIGKDLFDGVNQLESLDFDDMEQFVNAIMVFTNAKVDEADMKDIKTMGAVSIKSTPNQKASVSLLQGRLNASDTQLFYTRLLTALHQILGIPMATDSGSVTTGDTGKAKMTGQGYTSAGIRAKTDETMFKMHDFNALKVLLKICRISDSKIKELTATEVDNKMNRDMSDNLLVKVESLTSLLAAKIPKEYALPIVNLFGDCNAVAQAMDKQKDIDNEEQNNNNNNIDKTNQNNKIQQNAIRKAEQKNNQEQ